MRRIVPVLALVMAGCIHRRDIDPVPVVPLSSCSLVTVTGLTLTYRPVSGHCLSAKTLLKAIKSTASGE